MNKFTIPCTKEQTLKALELGAPIFNHIIDSHYANCLPKPWFYKDGNCYQTPTAEQMIGYLEEKYSLHFLTGIDDEDKFFFNVYHTEGYIEARSCKSRKEATLAAISSALEYLSKKQSNELIIMKLVIFEVAKAIKEARYPQEWNDTEYYYTENGELKRSDDYEGNSIEDIMYNQRFAVPAPYVMSVWLWLWREKKIKIDIDNCINKCAIFDITQEVIYSRTFTDPEEAIIAAIEYLVTNDLIK